MNIYNVANEFKGLKAILNSEGEGQEGLQEAVAEAFMELMKDQANGAEVAVQVIREAEALTAAVTIERDRLTAMIESRKNRIASAKNSVRESMIASDTSSIETTLGVFILRKGSEKTVVHDVDALIELSIENNDVSEAVKIEVVRKPVLAVVKKLIQSSLIPESIASLVRGDKTLTLK